MHPLTLPTIGIVDDDISVRKGLSRFLRSAGWVVDTYSSAEECLASPHLPRIGCFVIDVHLGGMSGFDLLRQLEKSGAHPPVVFITAHDESVTREALLNAGSPVCLRKPFAPDALLASIESLLHKE
jgi:FixJ family two-component response regulator